LVFVALGMRATIEVKAGARKNIEFFLLAVLRYN
jgi:hypothetical protein